MKRIIALLLFSTMALAVDAPKVDIQPNVKPPVLTDAQKIQALLIYKAQADKLIGRLRLQLQAAQQELQAEQQNSDQSLSLGIQAIYEAAHTTPDLNTFNFDTLSFTPVEKKPEPKKDDPSQPNVQAVPGPNGAPASVPTEVKK